MNREMRLIRAFVDLADTLGAHFDPLDLFARLTEHCTGLPAVDAVGVVMADARGSLRAMTASDDDLGRLDALQVRQGRGPSVDCFRTGDPVTADDLREGTPLARLHRSRPDSRIRLPARPAAAPRRPHDRCGVPRQPAR
ncbi:hypothetical protein [Streptomyces sp. AC555_RSS877]|uniref:hypothetical protein n=1 Tax=Streptomyces sp. AC555_RSS877 TaxID=2823688 RepID=UPI001C276F6A|nr:hypothetical protein [Streptomyces sp. AC555_RSS877]